ncbi:MAG: 3-dehydroquinate synthase [Bacteroidota bacterium]
MQEIKSKGYSIFIGNRSLYKLDQLIKSSQYSRIFILCDENTFTHCLPELLYKCPSLHESELLEIESGEESKSLAICNDLLKSLSESKADRKSLLLNLGGGVIGDLGGFTASIYQRGIDFIQVPTTLLAMADSSVGGKTGVDLDGIKNQVGTFSNPKGVFIFFGFLHTLNHRELISGFAEIIKVALISDVKLFDSLSRTKSINSNSVVKFIERSVLIKNGIVESDPNEKSIRRSLNFGHTIGHALESYFLSTTNHLLHGEAVALGMLAESFISLKMGMISPVEFKKVESLLQKFYKNQNLPIPNEQKIFDLLKHDKKIESDKLNFTLLKGIGKSKINCLVSDELISESLNYLWTE